MVIQAMSDTAIGPGCLKPVLGASRGGGAPAGVPHRGSRGGSSRGDRRHGCPPLRPACAHGGLLLLGHEPREEVADLLADVAHRVVIGLVRGEGVVGHESPAVSCNITQWGIGALGHWSIGATATVEGGTEGVEELRRTSEERDGHAQWGHEG